MIIPSYKSDSATQHASFQCELP